MACRQVRKEPLERLKAELGGRIYGPYKQGGIGNQPIYAWEISSDEEARAAAELIRPYLSTHKLEQLEFVLSEIDSNKRYSSGFFDPRISGEDTESPTELNFSKHTTVIDSEF